MSEERTLAESDSVADGTPAVADPADAGTPENANPAEPQVEGQPETAEAPTPGVQDTSDKRYKELQAKFTRTAQENARLKQILTPDVVAALQTGQQQQNTSGRELLKKKLESNPEIMDDPISNIQFHQNMTAAQIEAMLNERDAKQAFAEEAKKMAALHNVNLRDPEMEIAYRNARAVLVNSGKAEVNPYPLAFAFVHPDEAKSALSGKEQKMKEAERHQAATRLDKPGVPKVDKPASQDERISIDEWFRLNAKRDLGTK